MTFSLEVDWVFGSQRILSLRPAAFMAMAMCPGTMDRWETSTGVMVGLRDLTQSRKLP